MLIGLAEIMYTQFICTVHVLRLFSANPLPLGCSIKSYIFICLSIYLSSEARLLLSTALVDVGNRDRADYWEMGGEFLRE